MAGHNTAVIFMGIFDFLIFAKRKKKKKRLEYQNVVSVPPVPEYQFSRFSSDKKQLSCKGVFDHVKYTWYTCFMLVLTYFSYWF